MFPILKKWIAQYKENRRPVEISFSRVQAYLRCPWMYHLVYQEGWRSGPTAPAALGLTLHRALAAYLAPANTDRSWENLCQIYDEVWVNEGFSNTGEIFEVYDRGQKMLRQFYDNDQKRTSEVVATEKEFEVALTPRLRFRGTLDRLDRTKDGAYEIVEYKTQGDHWTELRQGQDLQMTLYALGMRESLKGAALKFKYHFLSNGAVMETHRTPAQLEAAAVLLKNVADKIRRNKFDPDTAYCGKCEFGKRCVNFMKGVVKVF